MTEIAHEPPTETPVTPKDRLNKLADWLEKWAVSRILSSLSHFALILALVAFALDFQQRAEDREQYQESRRQFEEEKKEWTFSRNVAAWGLLTTKSSGNSGKITAIYQLNKAGEELTGLDLSCNTNGGTFIEIDEGTGAKFKRCNRGVYLKGLKMNGKDENNPDNHLKEIFLDSNISGSDLSYSTFENLKLNRVNLSHSNLVGARFSGIEMEQSDFSGIFGFPTDKPGFPEARFSLEDSKNAHLRMKIENTLIRNSSFFGARLVGASFKKSEAIALDFRGADLQSADFSGVYFRAIRIDRNTNMFGINISGARKLQFHCTRRGQDNALCKEKIGAMWAWDDQPPEVDPRPAFQVWRRCPAHLRENYNPSASYGYPKGC